MRYACCKQPAVRMYWKYTGVANTGIAIAGLKLAAVRNYLAGSSSLKWLHKPAGGGMLLPMGAIAQTVVCRQASHGVL